MSEKKINTGVYLVIFLLWGIISLVSVYKLMEGIIDNKHDPFYISIVSINTFILIVICVAHLCNKISNSENNENIRIEEI